MSDYKVTDSELTGIANAIRTKGGTSSQLVFPDGFTSAIGAIPTGGGSTLITKNIVANGTYDAEDDNADGYSSVVVSVPSGGSGAEVMTRAEWNALTTAQKQAKGFVGIRNSLSGFEQGILVYGANYEEAGVYLPYSDKLNVICEAVSSDYEVGSSTWGKGERPVSLNSNLTRIENGFVIIDGMSNIASIYLGETYSDFTAYLVGYRYSGTGNRILSCFSAGDITGKGVMLYGSSTLGLSTFGSDTVFSPAVSVGEPFVSAMAGNDGTTVKGLTESAILTKNPSKTGDYITIGRKDIGSGGYQEPCTVAVKYVAVVKEFESNEVISNNLNYLANAFL